MRKFVQLCVTTFSLLFVLGLQSTQAQLQFGPHLGFNYANVISQSEGGFGIFEPKLGIRIGGSARYTISERTEVSGSLIYSVKGYTRENTLINYYHINYIELPVQVALKKSLTDKVKLMGFAGSYLGVGISGVFDPFKSDGLGYSPIDLGFILGAGVEFFDKLQARLSFEPGIIDLAMSDPEFTLVNQAITLDFVYFFGNR
ncbi:MAG: PorT family protein [Bacteroidia bacterium]|nr:PorT family protein [Bacteroidia bacterium]